MAAGGKEGVGAYTEDKKDWKPTLTPKQQKKLAGMTPDERKEWWNEYRKRHAWANKQSKPKKTKEQAKTKPFLTPDQVLQQIDAMANNQQAHRDYNLEWSPEGGTRNTDLRDLLRASFANQDARTRDTEWDTSARGLGSSSIRQLDLADIEATEHDRRQNALSDYAFAKGQADIGLDATDKMLEGQNSAFDTMALANADEKDKALALTYKKVTQAAKAKAAWANKMKEAARTGDYSGIKRTKQKNMLGQDRWVPIMDGNGNRIGWRINDKGWRLSDAKGRAPSKIGAIVNGVKITRATIAKRKEAGKTPIPKNPKPKGPGQNSGGNRG